MSEWSENSPFPKPGTKFRKDSGKGWKFWINYGIKENRPIRNCVAYGRFWFYSYRLPLPWGGSLRGYIGWKPITLLDTSFEVPDEAWRKYTPAREFSFRPFSFEKDN
jgi:hypothetical protein